MASWGLYVQKALCSSLISWVWFWNTAMSRQPKPVRWPLAITFITRQACACIRTLCVPLCLSKCLPLILSLSLSLSLSHTHTQNTHKHNLHTLMYHSYEYQHPLLYKDVQKYTNTFTQYTHTHNPHTYSHTEISILTHKCTQAHTHKQTYTETHK